MLKIRAETELDLPAILEVRGIDVVFLGLYDLSQSLDILGQVDHPMLWNLMEFVLRLFDSPILLILYSRWKHLGCDMFQIDALPSWNQPLAASQ